MISFFNGWEHGTLQHLHRLKNFWYYDIPVVGGKNPLTFGINCNKAHKCNEMETTLDLGLEDLVLPHTCPMNLTYLTIFSETLFSSIITTMCNKKKNLIYAGSKRQFNKFKNVYKVAYKWENATKCSMTTRYKMAERSMV